MQFFALDDNLELVSSHKAVKQKNYLCCECRGVVRLRKGLHRQPHFYHLKPTRDCRLSGKGIVHLQTQMHLYHLIPQGECEIEYRIPEIQRIADVAWIPRKLIFEIQYSYMTVEEMESRNADYGRLGWQVVWILHDHRYNRRRVSGMEFALRKCPHYFTDINSEGQGGIYDQLSIIQKGIRKKTSSSLNIDLSQPTILTPGKEKGHRLIQERLNTWTIHFHGDVLHAWKQGSYPEGFWLFDESMDAEPQLLRTRCLRFFESFFVRPYRLIFQMLLERICR